MSEWFEKKFGGGERVILSDGDSGVDGGLQNE